MLDEFRWHQLLRAFGNPSTVQNAFSELVSAYTEPHRHYHNADHVMHCLGELDAAGHLAERVQQVEFAIWLHDAVYRPKAHDNEERSARWADRLLTSLGGNEAAVVRIRTLIMATRHHAPSEDADTRLLLDVDLSILGQPPHVYDRYEKNVRKEYRWVPSPLYRRGRRKVLTGFLDRHRIFQTELFAQRYENRARENMSKAMSKL